MTVHELQQSTLCRHSSKSAQLMQRSQLTSCNYVIPAAGVLVQHTVEQHIASHSEQCLCPGRLLCQFIQGGSLIWSADSAQADIVVFLGKIQNVLLDRLPRSTQIVDKSLICIVGRLSSW